MYLTCEVCGEPMNHRTFTYETLVGYISPPGHNHDDNCKSREYRCKNNHTKRISRRNKCPACDWVGREDCFCHKDKKIDEWPEADNILDD